VTYSGTIAGAMEGTTLGVPSFALSRRLRLETRQKAALGDRAAHGPDVIRKVLAEGHPEGVLVNVNFPTVRPTP
jgi:5'-nucleotidase